MMTCYLSLPRSHNITQLFCDKASAKLLSLLKLYNFILSYYCRAYTFSPLTIASEDNSYILLGEGVDGEQHSRTLCGEKAKRHVVSGLAICRYG